MKNKLLLLILKEKKLILKGILSGFTLFLLYAVFIYVPLYSTSAKLFVRNIQKEDIVTPYNGGSIVQSESGYSNPLFNLIQVIKSQDLALRVYSKIKIKYRNDLYKFGVTNEDKWTDCFPKLIKAQIEPSSDIITVSFNWDNKKHTGEVLNIIISEFKKQNIQIRKSVEVKQREYIDTQISDIGDQLYFIKKQIKEYKLKNKAVDVANESIELTKARVDLEKQSELLKSEISYENDKFNDISSQLGFANAKTALRATAIGQDPYLVKLKQDLSLLQQNYAKLNAKFTDTYPDVVAAKDEINILSNNIKKREIESLSKIQVKRGVYDKPSQDVITDMSRVQAEKTSVAAKYNALLDGINQLKDKENKLPEKILGLEELQMQENALSLAYSNGRQKQMEAKIKENEIVDNIFSLEQKYSAGFLIKTIIMKFIGFLMLGFFISLGIAWVKEDIEDKWRDSQEIEDITGQKVLGVLPWVSSKSTIDLSFFNKEDSIMGIAFGNIASNIVSKSYTDDAQIISFISTTTNRGNSSIVPNIAYSLAKSDRSVILVDTNFTGSSILLKDFSSNNVLPQKDILDIISEVNKSLRLSDSDNNNINNLIAELLDKAIVPIVNKDKNSEHVVLHYLCAAKKADNIYNYVATNGFRTVMEFLKQRYEVVLIDTPSKSLIYPEFSSILKVSDAVSIISAMETNRAALIKIVDNLIRSNIHILGIIPREANSEIERSFNVDNFDKINK